MSLAKVWKAARGAHEQPEACLEAALAAALECPSVLRRIAEAAGWALPLGAYVVSTQDVVAEGRTDITLAWPGYRLVLELKVGDPPAAEQVEKYLIEGADVVAVARSTRRIDPARGTGRFLGVVTWRSLRDLDVTDAPLAFHQLHHLIDAMEVAVPNITLGGMVGLSSSWDAWQQLRGWSIAAADDVADDFRAAGHAWVGRHRPKGPHSFEENNKRYAAGLWPPPLRADYLKVLLGIFVGREQDPTLVEGVPDLLFFLHVDPRGRLGRELRADSVFCAAAETWRKRDQPSHRTRREFLPGEDNWEIMRARVSGLELLQEKNQELYVKDWLKTRGREWIEDGVLARLGALESETRPEVGPGAETA
jgi:hypothetical protein